MLRGCAVLFLKLQFLAFLAAGTAFANFPFGVLGFYGLIAIPDAWRSSNKDLRVLSTIGLVAAMVWASYAIYQMRGTSFSSVSSTGNKLLLIGMAALWAVLIVSLIIVGSMGNRSKRT